MPQFFFSSLQRVNEVPSPPPRNGDHGGTGLQELGKVVAQLVEVGRVEHVRVVAQEATEDGHRALVDLCSAHVGQAGRKEGRVVCNALQELSVTTSCSAREKRIAPALAPFASTWNPRRNASPHEWLRRKPNCVAPALALVQYSLAPLPVRQREGSVEKHFLLLLLHRRPLAGIP